MSKQWPTRVALAAIMATTLAITAPAQAQEPPVNTLTIGPMPQPDRPLQVNGYMLSAKAGALTLKAAQTHGAIFHVVVRSGPAQAQTLFEGILGDARTEVTVDIPTDGDYLLILTRIGIDGRHGHGEPFSVAGPGLRAQSLDVPQIALDNIETGDAIFAPLTVQARIVNGAPARYLRFQIDNSAPSDNLLKADSSAQPYTIDPATLSEGLHSLKAITIAPDAENVGVAPRIFVVDRVDSFTDVPRGYWGRTPIEALADIEILKGRGGGKFAPEEPVTREEFAKMVALVTKAHAPATAGVEFADVPADAWSHTYIQTLAAVGMIKGERVDGVDYFRPQRLISRAEAATIIGRSMGIDSADVAAGSPFTDFADVPVWAKTSVTVLAETKWLNGFNDGTFRPSGSLTRAQAAKMLSRPLGI